MEWAGVIRAGPRTRAQKLLRGQSRRGGTGEELRGSGSAEQSEEGVWEWSAREGGRGERGTAGHGVTLLPHFRWAGPRGSRRGLVGGQLPEMGCGNSSSLAFG